MTAPDRNKFERQVGSFLLPNTCTYKSILFVFVNGDDPSTEALGCSRGILDLGRVKVRVGGILVAYLGNVRLRNVVLWAGAMRRGEMYIKKLL